MEKTWAYLIEEKEIIPKQNLKTKVTEGIIYGLKDFRGPEMESTG